MADSLHLKPNLEYLKRQAKQFRKAYNQGNPEVRRWARALHPRISSSTEEKVPHTISLSDAQLIAARGYGFPSWPRFKAYIESLTTDFAGKVFAFLNAAVPSSNVNHRSGTLDKAAEILNRNPAIAEADIYTASVVGNCRTLKTILKKEPELVNREGGPRNWQPILYLCFSRFLRFQPEKTDTFVDALNLLLSKGADPNVHFMCGPEIETPLYGAAGVANNAGVMRALLEAGANVDDEDTHYHVVEFDNRECWRLLIEHGLGAAGKATMLLRRLDFEDPDGIRFLLDLGCDPNARGRWGKTALHQAIMRSRSREVIELLTERGADINAKRDDGKSVFALACRYGRKDVVRILKGLDVDESMAENDRLIGALNLCDEHQVREILATYPDLVRSLSERDEGAIVDAADDGRTEAVRLMLDAGFDAGQTGWLGGTALHAAAWNGHAETIALLLERNAPVDVIDDTHSNTPLGWGAYGSTARRNPTGNYPKTVQLLVEAGARIEKYMIDDATEEIASWLRKHQR